MKRILITGISGVGKSSVLQQLQARGYDTVDFDSPEWSIWTSNISTPDELGSPVKKDADWVWNEKKVADLLSSNISQCLIVSGTAENMGKFKNAFDLIILLSISKRTLKERLITRQTNSYGKKEEERDRILQQKDTIEPLLRQLSDYEIDTEGPIAGTLEKIETIVS